MSNAKELREKLMMKERRGAASFTPEVLQQAADFAEGYKKFLDASRTEREAVAYVRRLAEENGFVPYEQDKQYQPGDRVYIVNREKNIGLVVIGQKGTSDGVRLAIAHIDSPRIDIKPNPLYQDGGMALLKSHYYGGIKKYQWTTIPLSLHGRVVKLDGSYVDFRLGDEPDEECFLITDLLPHLDKEDKPVRKAIDAENMNILVGSYPYDDSEEKDLIALNIMNILHERYGITEDDFLSAELTFCPAYKTRDIGFDRSMLGGYGHDDKCCAYPSVMAAIDTKIPECTCITYLCDKEEIGSEGNTGMQSDFLRYFIYDLAKADGNEGYHVLSKSKCLSADVNAAFDPAYANAYEAKNCSYINEGVVISKYTGHGGKYDTSDASAEFMGEIRAMLEKNGVKWQIGELGRVDVGGGGTIAKYVANMNVDVVDLGVAVLNMHAPMEVISKPDLYMAYKAFYGLFN